MKEIPAVMRDDREYTMSPATGTLYAAIYARSATTGASIRAQTDACQRFAQEHGYVVPDAYVCLDDGCSGMSLERPGLQQLRELIRTRAIQAVIVADLARFSRRLTHLLLLVEECAHAEVEVHAVLSPEVPTLDGLRVVLHHADTDGNKKGATR
jgi:DNA invertase Pin-like site-specific DNA recombinase